MSSVCSAFAQQEIKIYNGAISLNGTLLKPKKAKILVIIVAGSGPTDRNGNTSVIQGQNNSLQYLSEGLESNGIASYRYDKRILNPENKLEESKLRFDDFVSDAQSIYQHFKSLGTYDKIGFAGHSEGSLISAIAVKNTGADFMISISGIATSADVVVKEQLASLPQELKTEAYTALDSLHNGVTVAKSPLGLESIFRPSVQPYLISWFQYDPAQVFASLTCPILILQGDNDIQVKTTEAEALHRSNPRSRLFVMKGMNHVLKLCSTDRFENISSYSNPKLPVPKELIKEMAKFLNGI